MSGPANQADTLSERGVLWLSIATAVAIANAYYIHPIIARVAESFEVSATMIGAVPALNQFALALGIFLLLPLGDRISNRRLVAICVWAQVAMLVVMAVAEQFWLFLTASTLLGFFTVTPYLLPAYASKRVSPARLGHVTAMLTTGVLAGILVSRAGSGTLGEAFGWRPVYWLAAGLMAITAIVLPRLMDTGGRQADAPRTDYGFLLASMVRLAPQYPQVLLAAFLQSLNFGTFLIVWIGLGLYLTGPEMGLGVDAVGYLAMIAVVNLLVTPRLGRWVDTIGPLKARAIMAAIQFSGYLLLIPASGNYWALIVPLLIVNMAGPMIDITGRMSALAAPEEIRSRLITIYIVIMFSIGGLASWAGAALYDRGGWIANCVLAAAMSGIILTASIIAWRRETRLSAQAR